MSLTDEEIVQEIERMDKNSKALKKTLLTFCWHMRGGLSYAEALSLSPAEQKLISDIIESNLELTKKTGLPYF